jgi:hypothetical protein
MKKKIFEIWSPMVDMDVFHKNISKSVHKQQIFTISHSFPLHSTLILTYMFCSLRRNIDSKLCPIIKIFIHKIANKNLKKTSQLTTYFNDHRIIHNHIWNNATKENLHSLFIENQIRIKLTFELQQTRLVVENKLYTHLHRNL